MIKNEDAFLKNAQKLIESLLSPFSEQAKNQDVKKEIYLFITLIDII